MRDGNDIIFVCTILWVVAIFCMQIYSDFNCDGYYNWATFVCRGNE